jgi:hypothetical protein
MQTFILNPEEKKHLENAKAQSFVLLKKAVKHYADIYGFIPDKAVVTLDWDIEAEPTASKEPVQKPLQMKLNNGEHAIGNFYDGVTDESTEKVIDKMLAPNEPIEIPVVLATEMIVLNLDADEKKELAKFNKLELQVAAIVHHLKSIEVKDEVGNTVAVDVATKANKLVKAIEARRKELSDPLEKQKKVLISIEKKLAGPLEEAVAAVKKKITDWTQEQERLRKVELQRQEDARKKEEQDRENERLRVLNIRNKITEFKDKSSQKVNAIEDLSGLEAFIKEINAWKPKSEFYQEFFTEIESEIKSAISLAEGRRTLIEEMEKQKVAAASANKKAAAAAAEKQKALQAQMELKRKNDELEAEKKREQAAQLEAANKIAIRNTVEALGWPADRVDGVMADIIYTYQSFTNAMAQIEKLKVSLSEKLKLHNDSLRTVASKATNQRVNWKFRILDATQVPREYLMVDEAKIKAAMTTMKEEVKTGKFNIAGVEFYDEASTVLK